MKEQLEKELKDIAIEILSTENKNISELKNKTSEIYDRLCVLAFTENKTDLPKVLETETNFNEEFSATEEDSKFIDAPLEEDMLYVDKKTEPITDSSPDAKSISEIIPDIFRKKDTLFDERAANDSLKLTNKETAVDVDNPLELLHDLETLTEGFDLPEFDPIPTTVNDVEAVKQKESLNDSLKKSIQIGLNDRLAFIEHLFDSNQDDYTRVLSQLNTFENSQAALDFINKMVKPEYNNWKSKEAFEARFLEVVFRSFNTL